MSALEPPPTARSAASRYWLGSGLVVFSTLSWGLITTFARVAYDGGATPHALVLTRFGAFVAVVGLLAPLAGRNLKLSRRDFGASLWMALAVFGMSFGYLSSVAYIPVSLAAMIFYTFPLMVGVMSSALGREPMTGAKALGLAVAFAGLALTLGPSLASLDARGLALALVAACSVAIFTTLGGAVLRRADTVTVNFYVNLWAFLGFGGYALLAGDPRLPASSLGFVGLAGATLCYLAASIAIFAALPLIAPVRVALLSNIEPLVSVAAATLILGEVLSPVQALGIAVVLMALVAMTLAGRRERA